MIGKRDGVRDKIFNDFFFLVFEVCLVCKLKYWVDKFWRLFFYLIFMFYFLDWYFFVVMIY